MYLIAERLKRPMRRLFGGKWVSMMGIPPLTLIFVIVLIPITLVVRRMDLRARRRRLGGRDVSETWIKSWF